MTLRDLLGDGPDVDVAALAFDNRAVQPGSLFFCVPGFTRDGHDFAADAVERGARRPRREPAARPRRARGARRRRPRRDGHRRRALPRRPDGDAPGRRDHRHEREDDHDVPPAPAPRGGGRPLRPAREREHDRRRRAAARDPHHAGGDRPPGDVRGDARRGRRGVRDGGLLARARAAPRRRRAVRGRGVHQPQPGPPGLPPGHGELLRGQGAAVRGVPRRRADRGRRRRLGRPARRAAPRRGHGLARRARGLAGGGHPRRDRREHVHGALAGGRRGGHAPAARPLQRGQRARGDGLRARARA